MERQLADVFASFCAFGSGGHARAELDSAKFAKLCRDCGLLGRRFGPTEADLCFSKVKPRGGRTIDFHVFKQQLLPEVAQRKGMEPAELVAQICQAQGPSSTGTVAATVSLHDDPTMYTGVYRHGGPTNTDLETADLYYIANRREADVRGVPQSVSPRQRSRSSGRARGSSVEQAADPLIQRIGPAEMAAILAQLEGFRSRGVPLLGEPIARLQAALAAAHRSPPRQHQPAHSATYTPPARTEQPLDRCARISRGSSGRRPRSSSASRSSAKSPREPQRAPWTCPPEASRTLEELFNSFCAFGAGQRGCAEMDIVRFAKFCRDTGLIGRRFTTTDADLVFSKVKPKGARTINFQTFRTHAVPEIAARRGCSADDLVATLRGSAPLSTGTVAAPVPLHDDKETYTGVYARGGPTNVDLSTADLSYIANRAPADVRGVNRQ
eukprot:TRINITY_DN70551_c0_g1_i1.p1 TRINITY_DN70551_c0_g1~~TRINITY_DN70551_c0_g1_i1.p1  ORF type:complete len:471 (+),score=111.34 TRINITY_DN70551_c0_g1_i1:99-1415(+)